MVIDNIIAYIAGTGLAFALLYVGLRPTGELFWAMLRGCIWGGLVGVLLSILLLPGCAAPVQSHFYYGLYPALEREGVFKQ